MMNKSTFLSCMRFAVTVLFALSLLSLLTIGGMAADQKADSSTELRLGIEKKMKGKTIALIPNTLGTPLFDTWAHVLKTEAEAMGMNFIVRDAALSGSRMTAAISELIARPPESRPAVIIVHNPNVMLLARLLKKAEEAGIYVVQVNMVSNYKTDAYVGADWHSMGIEQAEDIVKTCGEGSGNSGKVAIVEGETTSAPVLEMNRAMMSVFEKHPEIKVVSKQSANWNPVNAHDITATVLQQHPDLCATIGAWGLMMKGSSEAGNELGLLYSQKGQLHVYASGGAPDHICQSIQEGQLYKYWGYLAPIQAHDIMTAAKVLLQAGLKPGSMRLALYSPTQIISKEAGECFNPGNYKWPF